MAAPLNYVLVAVLMFMAGILPFKQSPEISGASLAFIQAALLVVSAVSLAAAWVVRDRMKARVAPLPEGFEGQTRAAVTALAVTGVPATCGMAYHFLTGSFTLPAALWASSVVVSLFLFPTKAWLTDNGEEVFRP